MAISGSMAGLAGGIELLGVTHRLFERFAAGYGYAGIPVALLAQLHPPGTPAPALLLRPPPPRAPRWPRHSSSGGSPPAPASCSGPQGFHQPSRRSARQS